MLVYSCQVYSIFIKCLLYNVVYNYCLECKVFVLILVYSPIYYPYVTISPSTYSMKTIDFMLNLDYNLYYLHLIHFVGKLLLHVSFHHLPSCVPVVIDMLLAFFHTPFSIYV